MLSKTVFIHSHINLAYKLAPFIIRDLRSRTITAAASERCSPCSIFNVVTEYFVVRCSVVLCGISKKLHSIVEVS